MILRSIVLTVLFALSAPVQAKCSPDSEPITLAGRLTSRIFPSPPNYASTSKGDRPETFWVLRLPEATCVAFAARENGGSAVRTRIMQLILRPEQYVAQKHLVGKQVRVTGRPLERISGHHHTAILLDEVSIDAIALAKP